MEMIQSYCTWLCICIFISLKQSFYSSLYKWYIKFRHASTKQVDYGKITSTKSVWSNVHNSLTTTENNLFLVYYSFSLDSLQLHSLNVIYFYSWEKIIIPLIESTTNISGCWCLPTCACFWPEIKVQSNVILHYLNLSY